MKLEVSAGFPYYIALAEETNYKQLFISQENFKLLTSLSYEQWEYKYAANKWNIKQIIGHITDHERIMIYRALRFSRRDSTPLAGYDQEFYVENSRFEELNHKLLLEDFMNVRKASITFINSLSATQLSLKGTAWKFELTVEEILKATIGHEIHHLNIIKERYLK